MDPLTITAAGGMRSRLESLEILSNNLANAATTGFKADREYLNTYLSAEAAEGAALSLGNTQGQTPFADSHWTDYSQGALTPTGNPLNIALSGSGFFVTKGPDGPLYTRNGNLRMDGDGVLKTQEGYEVASEGGNPIQGDPNLPVLIDKDGTVRQGANTIGKIQTAELNATGLAKRGAAYFQWVGQTPPVAAPAKGQIVQGSLEGSNASPVDSSVRLVNILRQFETLNRAVQLGAEMNKRAIEEVARVS